MRPEDSLRGLGSKTQKEHGTGFCGDIGEDRWKEMKSIEFFRKDTNGKDWIFRIENHWLQSREQDKFR